MHSTSPEGFCSLGTSSSKEKRFRVVLDIVRNKNGKVNVLLPTIAWKSDDDDIEEIPFVTPRDLKRCANDGGRRPHTFSEKDRDSIAELTLQTLKRAVAKNTPSVSLYPESRTYDRRQRRSPQSKKISPLSPWRTAFAPDGVPYYYNRQKNIVTWTPPKFYRDNCPSLLHVREKNVHKDLRRNRSMLPPQWKMAIAPGGIPYYYNREKQIVTWTPPKCTKREDSDAEIDFHGVETVRLNKNEDERSVAPLLIPCTESESYSAMPRIDTDESKSQRHVVQNYVEVEDFDPKSTLSIASEHVKRLEELGTTVSGKSVASAERDVLRSQRQRVERRLDLEKLSQDDESPIFECSERIVPLQCAESDYHIAVHMSEARKPVNRFRSKFPREVHSKKGPSLRKCLLPHPNSMSWDTLGYAVGSS